MKNSREGGHLQDRGYPFAAVKVGFRCNNHKRKSVQTAAASKGSSAPFQMPTLSAANAYPLCCKCLPSLLQMPTLSTANAYPLCCKCLPSLLQMPTLSAVNAYPLYCKCLPSLLQMPTLSTANAYPLCCKCLPSLANGSFL